MRMSKRDDVARLHAELGEARGQRVGARVELGVAHGPPAPADEGLIGNAGGLRAKQSR
jgi:hypothetical protein